MKQKIMQLADKLEPNRRAVVALITIAVGLGAYFAISNDWPVPWPDYAMTELKGIVEVAIGVLATTVLALLAKGDSSNQTDDDDKPPPAGPTVLPAAIVLTIAALTVAACTQQQARDAGRIAGEIANTAAEAHEIVEPNALVICKAALETAPEDKLPEIGKACGKIKKALDAIESAVDTADKVMGK